MPWRSSPQSPSATPAAHSIAPSDVRRGRAAPARPSRCGPGRVEVAAAVVVRAPCDRVVVGRGAAVLLVVGALVERGEDVDLAARLGGEVVPLVRPGPGGPDARHRGVRRVLVDDRGALELLGAGRVVEEPCVAAHVALPGPVAVGVRVGVDADDAAAAGHPALDGGPLGGVEDALAVRVEEDDDVEGAEVLVGELRRVLGQRDREAVRLAELRDRDLARVDRVRMAEPGRLGEHQHGELGVLALRLRARRRREHQDEQEQGGARRHEPGRPSRRRPMQTHRTSPLYARACPARYRTAPSAIPYCGIPLPPRRDQSTPTSVPSSGRVRRGSGRGSGVRRERERARRSARGRAPRTCRRRGAG